MTINKQAAWLFVVGGKGERSQAYLNIVSALMNYLGEFEGKATVDRGIWCKKVIFKLVEDYRLIPVLKIYSTLNIHTRNQNKNILQWHIHPKSRSGENRPSQLCEKITARLEAKISERADLLVTKNTETLGSILLEILASEFLLYPHESSPLKRPVIQFG